jgi:hypothetical protein
MRSLIIILIGVLVYGADPQVTESFVDYAADFDSSSTAKPPADPSPSYFGDETPDDAPAAKKPEVDPNLAGGSISPTADAPADTEAEAENKKADAAKLAEQEEKDFYDQCLANGYEPQQCCKTCVDSYLTSWADDDCYDARDCQAKQLRNAESAARSGDERAPAADGTTSGGSDSASDGVTGAQ